MAVVPPVPGFPLPPFPMPSPEEIRALGEKIRGALKTAAETINDIIDTVCDALSWLPGFLTRGVEAILRKLGEWAQKAIDWVAELLLGLAFPVYAFFLASDWNDKITKPVNEVSGAVSNTNLQVDDFWKGPAAEAYRFAVIGQTDAMTEVTTIVDDLKWRLWVVAALSAAFYVFVGTIVVLWIKSLIASGAATATGVGAVAGVPAAAAATGISIELIGAAIAAAIALLAAEGESITRLDGRISSSNKFPDGHWPVATTRAMSDASLNDGDDTDWHVKIG